MTRSPRVVSPRSPSPGNAAVYHTITKLDNRWPRPRSPQDCHFVRRSPRRDSPRAQRARERRNALALASMREDGNRASSPSTSMRTERKEATPPAPRNVERDDVTQGEADQRPRAAAAAALSKDSSNNISTSPCIARPDAAVYCETPGQVDKSTVDSTATPQMPMAPCKRTPPPSVQRSISSSTADCVRALLFLGESTLPPSTPVDLVSPSDSPSNGEEVLNTTLAHKSSGSTSTMSLPRNAAESIVHHLRTHRGTGRFDNGLANEGIFLALVCKSLYVAICSAQGETTRVFTTRKALLCSASRFDLAISHPVLRKVALQRPQRTQGRGAELYHLRPPFVSHALEIAPVAVLNHIFKISTNEMQGGSPLQQVQHQLIVLKLFCRQGRSDAVGYLLKHAPLLRSMTALAVIGSTAGCELRVSAAQWQISKDAGIVENGSTMTWFVSTFLSSGAARHSIEMIEWSFVLAACIGNVAPKLTSATARKAFADALVGSNSFLIHVLRAGATPSINAHSTDRTMPPHVVFARRCFLAFYSASRSAGLLVLCCLARTVMPWCVQICEVVCKCAVELGCNSLEDLLSAACSADCITDGEKMQILHSLLEPRGVQYLEWSERALRTPGGWLHEAVNKLARHSATHTLSFVLRETKTGALRMLDTLSIAAQLIKRGYALPLPRNVSDRDSSSDIMRSAWRCVAENVTTWSIASLRSPGWDLFAAPATVAFLYKHVCESTRLDAPLEVFSPPSVTWDTPVTPAANQLLVDLVGVPLFVTAWRTGRDDIVEALRNTDCAHLLWTNEECRQTEPSSLWKVIVSALKRSRSGRIFKSKGWVVQVLRSIGAPADSIDYIATACVLRNGGSAQDECESAEKEKEATREEHNCSHTGGKRQCVQ